MIVAKDKQLHFLVGLLLAWTGLIVTKNPIVAGVIAGLFWGMFKESIDKWGLFYQKRTGWSWMDIVATLAGSTLGGIILYLTNWHEAVLQSETVGDMVSGSPFLAIGYAAVIALTVYVYKKK